MAYNLKSEVKDLVKELIIKTCKISENNEKFARIEKKCQDELAMAPSFFANPNDIQRSVNGLCDKFIYHGLITQSNYLRQLADNFLKSTTSNYDLQNRLNIIQFLICMSDKPTDKAIGYMPLSLQQVEDDITDWASYLLPEELKWKPPADDTDESWDDLLSSDDEVEPPNYNRREFNHLNDDETDAPKPGEKLCDRGAKKTSLTDQVKLINWSETIRIIPESTRPSKIVGILYDEHKSKIMLGMNPSLNIIPEYLAMREIIWQFIFPHSSKTYTYNNGKFIPNKNVTIASVRQPCMYQWLKNFVPYLEYYNELREYQKILSMYDDDIPGTYQSYGYSLREFLQSLYQELINLEKTVKDDESFTLLKLWDFIKDKMEIVNILHMIHKTCVLDFNWHSTLVCSTNLLRKLHDFHLLSLTKLEQDVCLTVYLQTLYKYVCTIDMWLTNNMNMDLAKEFVIIEHSSSIETHKILQTNITELESTTKNHKLIQIIVTDIFAIIRNAHILNSMDYTMGRMKFNNSLHDEFINRILKKMSIHFGCQHDNGVESLNNEMELKTEIETNDIDVEPNENRPLRDLVDTSDGFLLTIYEYFCNNMQVSPSEKSKATLYERISEITTGLFPCYDLVHETLLELVIERFGKYGEQIKTVLIDKYDLKKHFEILRYVCLYEDDVIFPFYTKLFAEIGNEEMYWADSMELTSHLQNILYDKYGDLVKNCSIRLKKNAELCKDPLKAIALLSVNYKIDWPINMCITKEHVQKYCEIFQFLLQIKWALCNLKDLSIGNTFAKKCFKMKVGCNVIRKLNMINFELLRIFNMIQHYVLGYLLPVYKKEFDDELNAAVTFDDIEISHTKFIDNVYNVCAKLKSEDVNFGFSLCLYMVRKLRMLYEKFDQLDMLQDMRICLRNCCEYLESVMTIVY